MHKNISLAGLKERETFWRTYTYLWRSFSKTVCTVAAYKYPVGPPSVWRGSCPSTLLLLSMSLRTWQLQSRARTSSSSSCSWRVSCVSCSLILKVISEVGPSISSSVVLRSFVPLVYIVVFVLVVYLCPSSVSIVATFSGTVLFPLLCSVLPFFP